MYLLPIPAKKIKQLTASRNGEQKLGDEISFISKKATWEKELEQSQAKYCILGIPEDIGPVANLGQRGAASAFPDFLQAFLNIQIGEKINGASILLLGEVQVVDLMDRSSKLSNTKTEDLQELRSLVHEIDKRVYPIIQLVVAFGKIPIVIGGGHNNAYPLIKGSALGLGNVPIAAINIDPHADLRALEGRHSGNGFSYAIADGYLDRYFNIGLHYNYNNAATISKLKSDRNLFKYISLDDWLTENYEPKSVGKKALKFISDHPFGLEIDLDAIRFAESSAKTPVGLTESDVRKLVLQLARSKNIVYLNLSEGISHPDKQTGKLISYLVSDFIRASTI